MPAPRKYPSDAAAGYQLNILGMEIVDGDRLPGSAGGRRKRAHTNAQHHKSKYALRAAAMVRGGVDPGLLDEVTWWQTDDLWWWCLEALAAYVRAAADRTGDPVAAVCERIASRHGVTLTPTSP